MRTLQEKFRLLQRVLANLTKHAHKTRRQVCNARHGKRCKVKYQQACFGIATYQSHVSILGTVGYGPNMLPVRHSDGQE
jgi:glucose-6-phosphate-specific signal transduction histidine kinase